MPTYRVTRIYNYYEDYLIVAEHEEHLSELVKGGALEPYFTNEEPGHGELLIDELTEEEVAKIRKEHNISA